MKDDQMDELLIQAARDYNEPGAVPREEMWAAIRKTRDSAAGTRDSGLGTRGHSMRRLWVWPAVGVAAAALLAVGVMLGRRLERRSVAVPAVAANTGDSIVKQLHQETLKTDSAVRQLAQSTPSTKSRVPGPESRVPIADSRVPSPDRNLAYRLVVLRHLAGSEALITSFRAEAKRGEMDAQIARWSREMLGTTRLLEASAAADDPVMKRLLGDLDLIIAQIAVYATRGTNNPEELDLIEQSINQRGVIAKLRSTMPASPEGPSATHM